MTPSFASADSPVPPDATRLSRIRWRCRRGMLENDLVLSSFLARRGDALGEDEIRMLDEVLDLPDQVLWDLIAGRAQPASSIAPLVAILREQRCNPTDKE